MSDYTTPRKKKTRKSIVNPVNLNNCTDPLPIEVDREVVRSVACFGAVDSNVSFFQRNQSFQFFSPPLRRAVLARKKYLEKVQVEDYSRFLSFCDAYKIPIKESEAISEEVEEVEEVEEETTTITKEVKMALSPYFQSPNGKF